jgi:hypothetical protein
MRPRWPEFETRDFTRFGDPEVLELGSTAPTTPLLAAAGASHRRQRANFDIRLALSLRPPLTSATYTHSTASPHRHIANMQATIPSPQRSRASSGTKSPLSLDLSNLPPLVEPSPPSNTLIITVCLIPLLYNSTNNPAEPPRSRNLPHNDPHRAPRDHRSACKDPHLGAT